MTTTTTPRVYVGTYAKYNNGDLTGAWIDLGGHDEDSFMEAIKELHKDEAAPEFMFQDFEGFPAAFYTECHLNDALWDWIELVADDREIFTAYRELVYGHFDFETAREAYLGHFENDYDLGYYLVEECGYLGDIPEDIKRYFDYEAYGRDAGFDLMHHDGHYFYNT